MTPEELARNRECAWCAGTQSTAPYRTRTHVNEHSAALLSGSDRIVLALDALVNEMRDQTRAINALNKFLTIATMETSR